MADDAPFIVPAVIDDSPDATARVPDKFREVQWTRLQASAAPEAFAARVLALLTGVAELGRSAPRVDVAKPATAGKNTQPSAGVDHEPFAEWRPAPDQTVPNTPWTLERKLGEGGFGEVWLGRHRTMKEQRVFKFCFQAERVRSLKRELTLFRVLKERVGAHPNIVRLLDVHFNEPSFYVEMDYVAGQSLKVWCDQQGGVEKIPLAARLEIVAQIADALHAAHAAGVIHRDVKPGNILVSQSPAPNAQPTAMLRPSQKGSFQDIGQTYGRSPSPERKRCRRDANPLAAPICSRWAIQPLDADVCCFKAAARRSLSNAEGDTVNCVNGIPRPCASSRNRSSQSSARASCTASRSAPRISKRPARPTRAQSSWRNSARKAVEPMIQPRLKRTNRSSRAEGLSSAQAARKAA
ncbi:MAG: hypothetical protein EXS43_09475 [Opitutus sp.]|nr:hypothetical protein [Opitutus sp.]